MSMFWVRHGRRSWAPVITLVVCLGALAAVAADDVPRDRRMVFTTSSLTSTTTVPGPNRASTVATTPRFPTTTVNGVGFFQFYQQFPNSAISMDGQSFFVNYDKPSGSLAYVAELCYLDPTCVSFDWAGRQGWMHRVTHQCAGSVGGTFVDGSDDGGSVFFQLLPAVLAQKGINTSECWTPAGQAESTFDRATLAGQVFGTIASILITTILTATVLYMVMKRRRQRRQIAEVIDADADIDDGEDGAEVRAVRNNDEGDAVEDQLLAPA